MARRFAPLLTSIWNNRGFTALSGAAQRVYLMAFSQQNISWAGVVPYTEKRWASYARDTTPGYIADAVNELIDNGFVLLDPETEELWVRSFVKSNQLDAQKQFARSVISATDAIASPFIHKAAFDTLPESWKPQARSPIEACPEPPARLPHDSPSGSFLREVDLDLDNDKEGGKQPSGPVDARSVMAPNISDEWLAEADTILAITIGSHGLEPVERALTSIADERLRFPRPSDLRRALGQRLGPLPEAAKPSPLDDTAAAARRLEQEGNAQIDALRDVKPDPELNKAGVTNARAALGRSA